MQVQTINTTAFDEATPLYQDRLPELSLAGQVLLPVTVFVVSLLTMEFSRLSNHIVTIWPPNAILLAALLTHAPTLRNIGSILLSGTVATALANLAVRNATPLWFDLTAANMIEVAIALALLSAVRISASNLASFRNILLFILIAGAISTIGSAAMGAYFLGLALHVPWLGMWRNWYPAHALGMILVTPLLVSLASPERSTELARQRRGEALAILVLMIVVAGCAAFFRSILFIVVPVVLLATIRFGVIGATIATFLIAVIFGVFVVLGIGVPLLSQTELSDRILALQVLMAFTTLWSLPIAALLMERDRLFDDLSLANAQLKVESDRKSHLVIGLRRHLAMAEERERLRLSYELHDQAGQGLVAAILELSEVDSQINAPARERLHHVRKKMEDLGKTLHRIAWELRPPSIDELGLRKAVASYIADWGERCGTDVDFHCDDESIDDVSNEIGTAIYRVLQEGLTNIVKHALQPSSVSVVIRHVNSTLQVIIEDNGCGFDPSTVAAKSGGYHGLGLDGMRERLLLIGGTLEIESAVGAGTTLFARIPLDGHGSAT